MKYSFDQSVIVAILMAFLLMSLGCLALVGIGNLVYTARWVEHTQVVIDRLQTLLTDVEEESLAIRSFLLTGNSAYRQSFQDARRVVPAELQELKKLTSDNPARQNDLAQLQELLNQHLAVMERLGQSGENIQPSSVARQIEESNGLIAEIRDRITAMQAGERLLLQQRTVNTQRSSTMLKSIIVAGAFIGLMVLLVNTLSLRRETAIRQRAQRELDRFFTLTSDMFCIAGFDGYFKRLNPAWEKTLGYTRQELLSRPFVEFLHPDDLEKTRQEFARQKHGHEVVSFENRYRCKDGSYRWFLWSAQSLVDEQLIFASARDMTERKQNEQALLKRQQMFEALFESSPDAIILVNQEGRIVRANAEIEALFGYTRVELEGQSVEALMPERFRARHGGHLAGYFAAPCKRPMGPGLELFARRKDGSEFPVDIMLSALETSEGDHGLAVIRDITIRKEAAGRIQNLNRELEQRADMLEMANKELEAFSYSVSHDLRAPLRHIHGFVELLQKSPALQGNETSRRHMSVISTSAKQMGVLIDDLLAFSRTGRAEMHPIEVNMREIVDQIIQDREMECRERKITWKIEPLPGVMGDPALLRLVWMNLLDNALKYTRPRPETKIEIGHILRDGPDSAKGEAVFYVHDNGVGFDMQYASKLFGVFQRLHHTEDFEGTGIGLANVQRIIHRHGGRVWAESRVDSGATFYFSLPATATQPV